MAPVHAGRGAGHGTPAQAGVPALPATRDVCGAGSFAGKIRRPRAVDPSLALHNLDVGLSRATAGFARRNCRIRSSSPLHTFERLRQLRHVGSDLSGAVPSAGCQRDRPSPRTIVHPDRSCSRSALLDPAERRGGCVSPSARGLGSRRALSRNASDGGRVSGVDCRALGADPAVWGGRTPPADSPIPFSSGARSTTGHPRSERGHDRMLAPSRARFCPIRGFVKRPGTGGEPSQSRQPIGSGSSAGGRGTDCSDSSTTTRAGHPCTGDSITA